MIQKFGGTSTAVRFLNRGTSSDVRPRALINGSPAADHAIAILAWYGSIAAVLSASFGRDGLPVFQLIR